MQDKCKLEIISCEKHESRKKSSWTSISFGECFPRNLNVGRKINQRKAKLNEPKKQGKVCENQITGTNKMQDFTQLTINSRSADSVW